MIVDIYINHHLCITQRIYMYIYVIYIYVYIYIYIIYIYIYSKYHSDSKRRLLMLHARLDRVKVSLLNKIANSTYEDSRTIAQSHHFYLRNHGTIISVFYQRQSGKKTDNRTPHKEKSNIKTNYIPSIKKKSTKLVYIRAFK